MKRVFLRASSLPLLAVALVAEATPAWAQSFTVLPPTLAFGDQVVNSTSAVQTVT